MNLCKWWEDLKKEVFEKEILKKEIFESTTREKRKVKRKFERVGRRLMRWSKRRIRY